MFKGYETDFLHLRLAKLRQIFQAYLFGRPKGLDFSAAYSFNETLQNPVERTTTYHSAPDLQSYGEACATPIELPFFQAPLTTDQMYFLETSGRDHFSPRQACAIESAARSGNL